MAWMFFGANKVHILHCKEENSLDALKESVLGQGWKVALPINFDWLKAQRETRPLTSQIVFGSGFKSACDRAPGPGTHSRFHHTGRQ